MESRVQRDTNRPVVVGAGRRIECNAGTESVSLPLCQTHRKLYFDFSAFESISRFIFFSFRLWRRRSSWVQCTCEKEFAEIIFRLCIASLLLSLPCGFSSALCHCLCSCWGARMQFVRVERRFHFAQKWFRRFNFSQSGFLLTVLHPAIILIALAVSSRLRHDGENWRNRKDIRVCRTRPTKTSCDSVGLFGADAVTMSLRICQHTRTHIEFEKILACKCAALAFHYSFGIPRVNEWTKCDK